MNILIPVLAAALLSPGITADTALQQARPILKLQEQQSDTFLKLKEHQAGTLSKLKEQEAVTIYFSSFGCFSRTSRKLVLTRTANGVEAVLYDGRITYPPGSGPTIDSARILSKKILDNRDIKLFDQFETQLGYRREGGCTTIENYTLVSDYGSVTVSDGSCSWFGFSKLAEDLFGNGNQEAIR